MLDDHQELMALEMVDVNPRAIELMRSDMEPSGQDENRDH